VQAFGGKNTPAREYFQWSGNANGVPGREALCESGTYVGGCTSAEFGIDPTAGPGYALYTVEITGENILNALETSIELTSIELMGSAQGLTSDDFFLQVSGMRFLFDSSLADRPRVLHAWVGGPPLDPDEVYTLTLNYGNLVGLSMFPDVELAGEPELLEGIDEYAAVREFIQDEFILNYGSRGRSIDLGMVDD
jgi:hypothetical protein